MPEKHDHMEPLAIPPAAQQLLMQLQTFQQQYQTIAVQREALTLQKMELDKALEELEKTADKEDVFKAVGPILIKSTKSELSREMAEKGEAVGARLKGMETQEKKLREKISEVQQRLQSMLGGNEKEEAG